MTLSQSWYSVCVYIIFFNGNIQSLLLIESIRNRRRIIQCDLSGVIRLASKIQSKTDFNAFSKHTEMINPIFTNKITDSYFVDNLCVFISQWISEYGWNRTDIKIKIDIAICIHRFIVRLMDGFGIGLSMWMCWNANSPIFYGKKKTHSLCVGKWSKLYLDLVRSIHSI